MTRTRMSIWWLPVIVVAAFGIGAAIAIPLDNHEANQCEAGGGHLGPKRLCLTPDGKVIEP